MKFEETKILWKPKGEVFVLPLAESGYARPDLTRNGGAVADDWAEGSRDARLLRLLVLFHEIVFRDGVVAEAAHREFKKIDLYADAVG